MSEADLERHAAELLARAAVRATTSAALARPLGAGAVSGVSCRRVARGRSTALLAAGTALLALAVLLSARLSAAIAPLAVRTAAIESINRA